MSIFSSLWRNPFSVQFTILTVIGFWYLDTKVKWKKIAYSMFKFINIFSVTTVMFVEIIDLCSLKNNSSKTAERVCAATITCMIVIRTHVTLLNTQKFLTLQRKLTAFRGYNSNDPFKIQIIEESSNRIIATTKFFFGACLSVVVWTLLPLIEGDRRLPFPIGLPLNLLEPPLFGIFYVYLSILLYTFTISVVSNSLGFCSYMIQINSHFELLKRHLQNIEKAREEAVMERRLMAEFKSLRYSREKNEIPDYWEMEDSRLKDEITLEILKNVISTQKYVYEQVDCFKQLYSMTLLVHLTGVMFVVAVVEITGVDEDFTILLIKRVFYITVGVFDVFFICYHGQEMKQKSSEIIHAIYMIPWHEMDIRVQKILVMMTIRALKVSVLKAGDTISLDLQTFLKILRVAYNFVILLRGTV